MRTNLNPKVWGPEGWSFLKSCAHACDEDSLPHYEALLSLLPHVLPCEKCRFHADTYISEHPPGKASDLVRWLEDFEKAVRVRKMQEEPSERRQDGVASLSYLGLGVLLVILAFCCLSALLCLSRRVFGTSVRS
jgi:hypothetical protein